MEFNLSRRNYKIDNDEKEKPANHNIEEITENFKQVVEEELVNQNENANIEEMEKKEDIKETKGTEVKLHEQIHESNDDNKKNETKMEEEMKEHTKAKVEESQEVMSAKIEFKSMDKVSNEKEKEEDKNSGAFEFINELLKIYKKR
ncbi:MAG: hypothetical protein GX069_01230 [Tissierellia bacterium]|mgnify:CR=1 FL=1|nr:hypothetical protein [Tissierellia bacterium]